MKKYRPANIIIITFMLLFFFSLSLACNVGNSTGDITSKPAEELETTSEKGSKEYPFSKDETVTVEVVEWQLLGVENLGDTLEDPKGFFEDKKTIGSFIKIRVSVKNTGSEMKTLTSTKLR